MPRGVRGLSVRFDLKSRTAANYKQCGPPLFFSNCLSVDLIAWREMGSYTDMPVSFGFFMLLQVADKHISL